MTRLLRHTAIAAWHESARQLARLRVGRPTPSRDLSYIAIVAALGRRNGISRGATLQHQAMLRAGQKVQLVDATAALRNPFARVRHQPASGYVFHSGAPETSVLLHGVLPEAAGAWRIGYWAWELPEPPPGWRRFAQSMSEIWTPSRFTADSLGKLFDGPIRVVPHQVEAHRPRQRDPSRSFTVLTMADSRSSFARKNPEAVVRAFRQAFGDSSSARLIVKLNGRRADVDALLASWRGFSNVDVVARFLTEAEMIELYRSADVLMSLHRAEGFGLPMLEAMSYGVPVIATGWSGNTDFMFDSNSMLVPFTMVPVRDAAGIYAGGLWAEPDINAAAGLLRHLAEDIALHTKLAKVAHDSVQRSQLVVPT